LKLIATIISAYALGHMAILLVKQSKLDQKKQRILVLTISIITIISVIICLLVILDIFPRTLQLKEVENRKAENLSDIETDIVYKEPYEKLVKILKLNTENLGDNSYKFSGEIQNIGNKEIFHIRFNVYFLDSDENPIYEDKYNLERSIPALLKPNYIKNFSFFVSGVPNSWRGKIRFSVFYVDVTNERLIIKWKSPT